MIKKNFLKVVTLALMTSTFIMQMACSRNVDDHIIKDGLTLNVKFYDAGYGRSYISAVKEKYEETFADKGYKLNILPPDGELGNTNLLMDIYRNSGTDIYFCSCSTALAASGYMGQYGTDSLVLDITDGVMNKKPIKFDGTEENNTVLEKLEKYSAIVKDIQYRNKYYKIPYVSGLGGLAVNTKVLKGYNLEVPKTTNELFNCVSVIMSHASDDYIFPFTFSTAEYPDMMLKTWFRQYIEEVDFEKFYSMEEADGTKLTEPYKVFGEPDSVFEDGLIKAFEAYYQAFDYNIAAPGATTHDFTKAQAQLMNGDAVFYVVGDFMLNEEFDRFKSRLNDITFINFPVLSSVGTKLFGSEPYNKSAADCEKILRDIIDGVDENKSVADIKSIIDAKYSASFAESDILKACESRGVVYDQSGSSIFISKNISEDMKPIAELFLRYCASSDVAGLIAQNTRVNNPFSPEALADSPYPWIRNTCSILKNVYSNPIVFKTKGYRSRLSLGNFVVGTNANTAMTLIEEGYTIYDDDT